MQSIDVSIIIVNWNVRDILRDCLRSIYDHTKSINFEIIVIDNASSDNSCEMVAKEFPQVFLIANKENRGFAAANNQGLKVATGKYVLLLNPDTIVPEDTISKSFKYSENHTDVAVLGCQVWLNENEIQKTCFSFPTLTSVFLLKSGLRRLFPKSRLLGWIDYGWWDRTTLMEVDVVSGMYMFVRQKAIKDVGVMDEDYFVFAEETDWCFRFCKAGWKCIFVPLGRIIHLDGGSKSTDLIKIEMFVQHQKSILLFIKKNRGVLSFHIVKLIFIFSMVMRLSFSLITGCWDKSGKSERKQLQSIASLKYLVFKRR